jgi:hypothetical protein
VTDLSLRYLLYGEDKTATATIGKIGGAFGKLGSLIGGEFGDVLDKVGQGIDKMGEKAHGMGAKMVGAGAVITAAGVALQALGSADKAAADQLAQAIKASGHSVDDFEGSIHHTIGTMENFGHSAVDTSTALRILTQATNDPAKAIASMGLVANLAAARHISLADASALVAKIMGGSGAKTLVQYGIHMKTTGDKTENAKLALQELAKKLDGQASASVDNFGGKVNAIKTKIGDWAAEMGQKLGPVLTALGPALMVVGTITEMVTARKVAAAAASDAVATSTLAEVAASEALGVAAAEELSDSTALVVAKESEVAASDTLTASTAAEAAATTAAGIAAAEATPEVGMFGAAMAVAAGPIGLIIAAVGIATLGVLAFTRGNKESIQPINDQGKALTMTAAAYKDWLNAQYDAKLLTADNIRAFKDFGVSANIAADGLNGNAEALKTTDEALQKYIESQRIEGTTMTAGRGSMVMHTEAMTENGKKAVALKKYYDDLSGVQKQQIADQLLLEAANQGVTVSELQQANAVRDATKAVEDKTIAGYDAVEAELAATKAIKDQNKIRHETAQNVRDTMRVIIDAADKQSAAEIAAGKSQGEANAAKLASLKREEAHVKKGSPLWNALAQLIAQEEKAGADQTAIFHVSVPNVKVTPIYQTIAGVKTLVGEHPSSGGRVLFAKGGIVRKRPGGVDATIAEGQYDEAVVPLKPGMGLGGDVHVHLTGAYAGDKVALAKLIQQTLVEYKNVHTGGASLGLA